MKEGDVILTPVPQADGNVKDRPAIILGSQKKIMYPTERTELLKHISVQWYNKKGESPYVRCRGMEISLYVV